MTGAWSDLALLMEQTALRGDAAAVSAMVMRGASAEADRYAVERRVAARLAAYKAAGGVL